jgi:tRNA(fMet)-specific endonuclease VapC
MIYLLDTDTLINVIRGLKAGAGAPARSAQRIVAECQSAQGRGDDIGVSAITLSELEYGARRSGRYPREISAVQKLLTPFTLYDYDAVNCAVHYGEIRHELEVLGQPIGPMDLLIAAQAKALQATLISANVKHFRRVPGLTTLTWG